MKHYISEEQREHVYELCMGGFNIAQIKSETGLARQTIKKILADRGMLSVGGQGGRVSKTIKDIDKPRINNDIREEESLLITDSKEMDLVSAKTGNLYKVSSTSDKIRVWFHNNDDHYVFIGVKELEDVAKELIEAYKIKQEM